MVPFRAALLALTVLSCSRATAAEECDLPRRVQQQELVKMSEANWVLVEAFSDYPAGKELLMNANSSIVEVKRTDANGTFLFSEKNIVAGKCLVFHVNMSIPDPEMSNHSFILTGPGVMIADNVVSPYDDKGRLDVHQACPDCLLIVYNGVFDGTPGRMLLIYRREGKHLDADELKAAAAEHRKIAECLKFDMDANFRYDGEAEFCLDKKEEKAEA